MSVLFGDLLSHSYNITLYLVAVVFDGMKLYVFEEQFLVCEVNMRLKGSMLDLCTVLADPRSKCE